MLEIGFFGRTQHDTIPDGWPSAPSALQDGDARRAWEQAMTEFERADALGFDFVTVSEHHYSAFIDPNPLMTAAALSQRLTRARISVLGASVSLLNPVRVAEETAMLDVITDGTVRIGLLRGTPNEALTYYNINPRESREKFQEAVELIQACWSEPEPFAWEGTYYRFRSVAVWPRAVRAGGPRLLLSGSNPVAVEFVARSRADLGLSYVDLADAAERIGWYRESAERHGWAPDRSNVLYRNFAFVAETDAEALALAERHGFGDPNGLFHITSRLGMQALMESVTGSFQAMAPSQHKYFGPDYVPPVFCGSPETVIEQIRAFSDAGVGQLDLAMTGWGLPAEVGRRSVELFAAEVLPVVRQLDDAAAAVSS